MLSFISFYLCENFNGIVDDVDNQTGNENLNSRIVELLGVGGAGGIGVWLKNHMEPTMYKNFKTSFLNNEIVGKVHEDPNFTKKILNDMFKDYKAKYAPNDTDLNLRLGVRTIDPSTGKITTQYGAYLNPSDAIKSKYVYGSGDKIRPYIQAADGTAAMAHELGHAASPNIGIYSPKWSRILTQRANMFSQKQAPIFAAADAFNRGYNSAKRNEGNSIVDYGLGAANMLGATSTAIKLGSEADASIRGLRSLKRVYGAPGLAFGAKTMVPAFGQYALGAALTHGAIPLVTYGAGRLYGSLTNN